MMIAAQVLRSNTKTAAALLSLLRGRLRVPSGAVSPNLGRIATEAGEWAPHSRGTCGEALGDPPARHHALQVVAGRTSAGSDARAACPPTTPRADAPRAPAAHAEWWRRGSAIVS